MPKDTKTLGNNKARACESLGFVHKKRLCQRFDTTSLRYRKKGVLKKPSNRLMKSIMYFLSLLFYGISRILPPLYF